MDTRAAELVDAGSGRPQRAAFRAIRLGWPPAWLLTVACRTVDYQRLDPTDRLACAQTLRIMAVAPSDVEVWLAHRRGHQRFAELLARVSAEPESPVALALAYLPTVRALDYVYRTDPDALAPIELADPGRFPAPVKGASMRSRWSEA